MKRLVLSIIVFSIMSVYSYSISPDREIQDTYARMSIMFQRRSTDGVMDNISDKFQSELGWNANILRHVLNQLFGAYPIFSLQSKLGVISVSSTEKSAIVEWKGTWIAKMSRAGDERNRFSYFGARYIRPESSWVQVHHLEKIGKLWKITRVQTKWMDSHHDVKSDVKSLIESFHEKTGELGIAFGRNILNSIDTNGIIFLSGESPCAAVTYLKENLHERPDITVYDYGFWYGDIPGAERLNTILLEMRPRYRQNLEYQLIQSNTRPFYTMSPNEKYDPVANLPGSAISYRTRPHGLVYEIVPLSQWTTENKEKMPTLLDLDKYLPSPSNHLQRELVSNYHFGLGQSRLLMGDKSTAQDEFQKAANIGYDVEGMNVNVGNLMHQLYQSDSEAIYYLDRETKYNPWVSQVYLILAELQQKNGQFNESIFNYRYALLFDPSAIDIHLKLGRIYNTLKNYQYAKNEYSIYLQEVPYNKDAFRELGEIYEKTNQLNLAIKQYKEYLKFPVLIGDTTKSVIQKRMKNLESKLKGK